MKLNKIEIIYKDNVIDQCYEVEDALILQKAYNNIYNTDEVEIKIPIMCIG